MATASGPCWSSLPSDLVNLVAGCFVDSADIDCYMDLRAVCRNWRAATADPRNTLDPCFRPRNWVMLQDQDKYDVGRLMVNTATGRFLRKKIPMLDGYCVVCCTADGLLVLADWGARHLACVLNPLTGYMVRFKAPMRDGVFAAAVSTGGGSSPPTLLLYCYCNDDGRRKLYRATPDSESFTRYKKYTYPLAKKAVVGCFSVERCEGGDSLPAFLPAPVANKITDLMAPFAAADAEPDAESPNRCFMVESAGETLVVFKLGNRVEVFKMCGDGTALEPVNSIGNRSIFLGGCFRCLSLDADNFPSIEPNCIYSVDGLGSPSIQVFDLKAKGQGQSATGAAAPSADWPAFLCNTTPGNGYPITIIQLLAIYTLPHQAALLSKLVKKEEEILEALMEGNFPKAEALYQALRQGGV
ncbi:hypothetical protein U9M48_026451 [Paspalum notatum var. saurae]|uniref:KIB1-4 beta-propeller domain-containing protein n=1 Tax=Paspalum notatum var. saurae TaxID=547442 RepID=A0AAQ3TWJ7_PASNO